VCWTTSFGVKTTGLKAGEEDDYVLKVSDDSVPLKVTLVYNDYPDKDLINSLNLQLFDPFGNYFWGNDFDGSQRPDNVNNVEGILVQSVAKGQWRITVVATDLGEPAQDYALVISGGDVQLN
jgi:serine protease AprX